MVAGSYTFEVYIASMDDLRVEFDVTSSSKILSTKLSSATLSLTSTEATEGEAKLATVTLNPLNALGETITDLAAIDYQVYCYFKSDKGEIVELSEYTTLESGEIQITSPDPIINSGNYSMFVEVDNPEIFRVSESFINV